MVMDMNMDVETDMETDTNMDMDNWNGYYTKTKGFARIMILTKK
jgi:hypothetical protein